VRAKQIPLSRSGAAIGRQVTERGLKVSDQRMSRTHFRIEYDGRSQAWLVKDHGSSNGTFVNGRRVGNQALVPNDVVRAGDTMFLFHESDAKAVLEESIPRVARTDLTVLIRGETGAGKDVLARRIHEASGRTGQFVAVNCAALPKDLIEAELFGHSKGAFSGADRSREGLFVAATSGTLFLDEIGDLPMNLQPALLRALQARKVRAVGSDREVDVDCRIIAATNADLESGVAAKSFRADLYARLAQMRMVLPPLRERRTEIIPLLLRFVRDRFPKLRLVPDSAEVLTLWDWPYNVRELESLAKAFSALADENAEFDIQFIRDQNEKMWDRFIQQRNAADADGDEDSASGDLKVDANELYALLGKEHGNVSAVAREMGKPRTQIYRWMKTLGVSAKDFR
jgi:transcriptional regulator with GAF, ATPase, and Fis domain